MRLSLAEALTAGVTTTHNWAHNVRSPAHADAEVRAMRESGLRGRFAYGPALGMPNDQPMDFADMARLKRDIGKDTMLTLGMCSRNIDGNNASRGAINADMAKKEWSGAREIGLPITLHTNGSASIQLLDGANLLGKDVQLVHPLKPGREGLRHAGQARRALQRCRRSARPAVTGEMQFAELMQAGVLVSMSIDNVTAERCDCFACMHMMQTVNKHRSGGKFKLTDQAAGAKWPPSRAPAISASTTSPARSRRASAPT